MKTRLLLLFAAVVFFASCEKETLAPDEDPGGLSIRVENYPKDALAPLAKYPVVFTVEAPAGLSNVTVETPNALLGGDVAKPGVESKTYSLVLASDYSWIGKRVPHRITATDRSGRTVRDTFSIYVRPSEVNLSVAAGGIPLARPLSREVAVDMTVSVSSEVELLSVGVRLVPREGAPRWVVYRHNLQPRKELELKVQLNPGPEVSYYEVFVEDWGGTKVFRKVEVG